ncbi:MAG: hypothetical protein AVDCRST_MAG91-1624, partial [uncultured Sphingomonadaceae bacterium]
WDLHFTSWRSSAAVRVKWPVSRSRPPLRSMRASRPATRPLPMRSCATSMPNSPWWSPSAAAPTAPPRPRRSCRARSTFRSPAARRVSSAPATSRRGRPDS